MKLTTTQKMLEQLKKPGKNKKTKLNHQQNHRIPLRNSFEILSIEEYQDKQLLMRTTPMLPSFYDAPSKRRQKKQSKHNKQPEAYITNGKKNNKKKQNTRIVPGRKTYSFGSNQVWKNIDHR